MSIREEEVTCNIIVSKWSIRICEVHHSQYEKADREKGCWNKYISRWRYCLISNEWNMSKDQRRYRIIGHASKISFITVYWYTTSKANH